MHTLNASENALWISVLILTSLIVFVDRDYSILLAMWIISIIATGNAKRIYTKDSNFSISLIRRSTYFIPLIIPIIIYPSIFMNSFNVTFTAVFAGILLGFCLLLPNFKTWKLVLSKEFIKMTLSSNSSRYWLNIYTAITSAISEELFFRGFVLLYTREYVFINCILSILFFLIFHFGTKWNDKFAFTDYIFQILFAFFSVLLVIFFDSLVPSIIAHLIYNSPHIYKNILSIYFARRECV